MKFYKLELINREQSYNQMFGTTPNVGVLNPVSSAKAGAVGGKTSTTMVAPTGKAGMGMGIGGMGISGGVPATAAAGGPQKDQARGQKSRLVQQ